MFTRRRAWIGAVLAACASAFAPAWCDPVDWVLYDRTCVDGSAQLEIPCGDYGVFHMVGVVAGTCPTRASGVEESHLYAAPPHGHAFPVAAPLLRQLGTPHETESTGELAVVPSGRREGGPAPRFIVGPGPPPPQPPPPTPRPWLAMVDFTGAHGDSTTWLASEIAGDGVDTFLSDLDDPQLAPLGDRVGDFHVLSKLCEVAEKVDHSPLDPPLIVNMSFGRAVFASTDPTSAAGCNPASAPCQIAQVLARLRQQGSVLVAAAGNQQQLLFPASLDDVMAVGMQDLNRFLFNAQPRAAWETPTGVNAWMPGNALCLDAWAIPAGSSYSSAVFAGWLVELRQDYPTVDPLVGPTWMPRWSTQSQCVVLAQATVLSTECNPTINLMFAGLVDGYDTLCWSPQPTVSETVPPPGTPQAPTTLPTFEQWVAGVHREPESDPCVPCVGKIAPGGVDLNLDVSAAQPLPSGTYIDSLSLRVTTNYYPLTVTSAQLSALAAATLDQLVLSQAGSLVAPGQSVSLYYRLKNDPNWSCNVPNNCYWRSTPVLMKFGP
ncbi:MAG TPA: S8/S53 family peptidase [Candidatus Polarisedimenticolaceae bacterium]|nr:S8/S53 family peptidase [Candidatus Polarisedimenticolaceae bacterium]